MSERLTMMDTGPQMVEKLCDGNPGAINVMMQLSIGSQSIDPQSMLGAFAPLLSLDTHGIYGADIYVLWKDKCGGDTRRMCMLLRAIQLGFISEIRVKAMAAEHCGVINLTDEEWNELDAKVCDSLTEFAKPIPSN